MLKVCCQTMGLGGWAALCNLSRVSFRCSLQGRSCSLENTSRPLPGRGSLPASRRVLSGERTRASATSRLVSGLWTHLVLGFCSPQRINLQFLLWWGGNWWSHSCSCRLSISPLFGGPLTPTSRGLPWGSSGGFNRLVTLFVGLRRPGLLPHIQGYCCYLLSVFSFLVDFCLNKILFLSF